MAIRLQAVMGNIAGIFAGLLLAGCAQDLGVDQHGQKVAAERVDGQWLVINYWAEWCAPCRSEVPQLNALAEELRGQPVSVFGVNFDGLQGAELSKASQALGIEFTVLAEDPATRFGLSRAEVLPVTFIVDRNGKVRERLLGEQTAAGLRARLTTLQKQE
nr:TlpA disulfide reductase family protein [uncultured Pseudomonas sp.]